VHPLEFVADVASGVGGGVLDHAEQEQGEPAQLDVGADPVLAVVEDRAQAEGALHVAPAALRAISTTVFFSTAAEYR